MVLRREVLGAALLVVVGASPAVYAARGDDAVRLLAHVVTADQESLRAGSETAWAGVPVADLHLNRTPPLYEGDPLDGGGSPILHVSLAETTDLFFVRLTWRDSTDSKPSDPARYPDAGESAVYKAHSADIERFADAACVMVPRQMGSRTSFPSLMMGEPGQTVDLYYWHHVKGFQHLQAAGRGTTGPTGETIPGTARRTKSGWSVVFQLPVPVPATPYAFAVWDGDRSHRDGLKWFSIWYEVSFGGAP